MTQAEGRRFPNLTVSVFLRSAFLRGADDGDGLFAWIEERLRSGYPGASVSVRAADLLDHDWEAQIGELGDGRLSDAARADIQRDLNALLGQAITQFPRPL